MDFKKFVIEVVMIEEKENNDENVSADEIKDEDEEAEEDASM